MKIRYNKKYLLRFLVALGAFVGLMLLLINFPQPFFRASARVNNLTLFSDRDFTPEAGQQVLNLVETKLAKSPLYTPAQARQVFICNSRWRELMFFTYQYGVGGVNYYPLSSHAFVREGLVDENRLIGPRGKRVEGDRTLDYFIAHEITHALTGQAVGGIAYHRLPQWKREGYADYIGKGESFNYDEARQAFLAGDRKMDWAQSGLYSRFHLLVAHLLDKKHWSVQQLLTQPVEQTAVEQMVRAEK